MNCIVERQKTVHHSTLSLVTGEVRSEGRTTVEVGPCNTPLFGNEPSQGICRSCSELWEHPENTITPRGLEQIIEATEKKKRGPLDVARALLSSPRLRGTP